MIPPKLLFMRVSCINGLNEIWTNSHLDVFMTAISGPYTVSCMPVKIRERIHVRSQDNAVALVHVCMFTGRQRLHEFVCMAPACMNMCLGADSKCVAQCSRADLHEFTRAWELHAFIYAWS